MSKGALRFFFDYGAGGCLWAGDDATREKLGVGPIDTDRHDLKERLIRPAPVAVSAAARILRDRLDAEHVSYLNPVYPPDPSLWTQARCDRFNAGVEDLLSSLRAELAMDYGIVDEQERYREDPALAAYLTANPGLKAME